MIQSSAESEKDHFFVDTTFKQPEAFEQSDLMSASCDENACHATESVLKLWMFSRAAVRRGRFRVQRYELIPLAT